MAEQRETPDRVALEHKLYTDFVPLMEQIRIIGELFTLDTKSAYAHARHLPSRPVFSVPGVLRPKYVHWLAFPTLEAIGAQLFAHEHDLYVREAHARSIVKRHLEKLMHVQMLLGGMMRTEVRAKRAIAYLKREQKSPILIVPVQRGIHHLGKSVAEVCEGAGGSEFGLTFVMAVALVLTHPHLFGEGNQFCMDLPGTEVFIKNRAVSGRREPYIEAPFIRFHKRRLILSSSFVHNTDRYSGSATFFLPHTFATAT